MLQLHLLSAAFIPEVRKKASVTPVRSRSKPIDTGLNLRYWLIW